MGNMMRLELTGFEEMLEKLDKMGAELEEIVTDCLEQAGETIGYDTLDAIEDEKKLPAGGNYSTGETKETVILEPKAEKSGNLIEIGVGFDMEKPGAGIYLITGTPKMPPVYQLNKMYRGKKYMKQIQNDIRDILTDEMVTRMEK